MPKAVLTTPSGAVVTIDGTESEVANLIRRLDDRGAPSKVLRGKRPSEGKRKVALTDLVSELIAEGLFREPKELGDIQASLREQGHFYPVTSLSPTMLRFVRKRILRRIKEGGRWKYVGGQ